MKKLLFTNKKGIPLIFKRLSLEFEVSKFYKLLLILYIEKN